MATLTTDRTCPPDINGWVFFGLYNAYSFQRGTGAGYSDIESSVNYSSYVNLNDSNKDREWMLRSVTTIFEDTRVDGLEDIIYTTRNVTTELTAIADNKEVEIGTVFDNNYTAKYPEKGSYPNIGRLTLLNYQFVFCGEVKCCCCPIPLTLPQLIESKLRFVYA